MATIHDDQIDHPLPPPANMKEPEPELESKSF